MYVDTYICYTRHLRCLYVLTHAIYVMCAANGIHDVCVMYVINALYAIHVTCYVLYDIYVMHDTIRHDTIRHDTIYTLYTTLLSMLQYDLHNTQHPTPLLRAVSI